MEATLEQLDEAAARIRLKGEVQGSALGGAGTITCEGFLNFDRKAGLVDRLEVNRVESRQPGPVEAGLDVKSTLTVLRRPPGSRPSWTMRRLPISHSTPRRSVSSCN